MKVKYLAIPAVISFLVFIFSCSSVEKLSDGKKAYDFADKEAILSQMTLEEKIAQLFIVIPEQIDDASITKLSKSFASSLKKHPAGGFILFAYHIENFFWFYA